MKFQVEILSYTLFSFLVITVSAFIIYYFWFFQNTILKNINKINLYSFLNIFESPIIVFNSVCNFCKINYNINLVQIMSPSRFLFLVYYSDTDKKIKFEELYSQVLISSSILNHLQFYANERTYIFASSSREIVFEINNFEKAIVAKNV